jgi:hypothetical protein
VKKPALLPALLAALAAGCSDQGPHVGALEREIAANRALWEANGPSSYVYDVERLCFCGVEALGPVRVVVENGVAVGRTYVATGEVVPASFADLFPSVDGLFEVLTDAVQRGAADVRVTWGSGNGLPLDFFIDYSVNIADEEQGYRIVDPPRTTP